jgi:hypothetical protein
MMPSVISGCDDVARQHQLTATAERVPGHRGHQRLAQLVDVAPGGQRVTLLHVDDGCPRHLGHVRPGRKRPLVAQQ